MQNNMSKNNCRSLYSVIQTRERASNINSNVSALISSHFSYRLQNLGCLYQKDLYAHYGCVNAIEFSKNGEYLSSGGDDGRVLLWDMASTLTGNSNPVPMKGEHKSNIFCLGFSHSNSRIYSAGNDELVVLHDVVTKQTIDVFPHEEAIYGVSVNPKSDSVFVSAGEGGQVLLFDTRLPSSVDPLCIAKCLTAFHSVQFHPCNSVYVVTANSYEGTAMWDIRMPQEVLQKFLDKPSQYSKSAMCARFNSLGTQIIVLRRRLPPVLYNVESEMPVCTFDAEHYYNSCTMKSCCFAGSNDELILSGSDDFNLYMWKIPQEYSGIKKLQCATLILKGHRSIVNQVRFNSHSFVIASSGVEKIIKLWSGIELPGSNCCTSAVHAMSRKVYTQEEYLGLVMEGYHHVTHDYTHGSTKEDPRMMAFFDSLVQREVEGWTTDSDFSDYYGLFGQDDTASDAGCNFSDSSSSSESNKPDDNSNKAGSTRLDGSSFNKELSSESSNSSLLGSALKKAIEGSKDPRRGTSEWMLKLITKKRDQIKSRKKWKRKRKRKRMPLHTFSSDTRLLYHPAGFPEVTGQRFQNTGSSLPSWHRMKRFVGSYTVPLSNEMDNLSSDSDSEKNVLLEKEECSSSDSSIDDSKYVRIRKKKIRRNTTDLNDKFKNNSEKGHSTGLERKNLNANIKSKYLERTCIEDKKIAFDISKDCSSNTETFLSTPISELCTDDKGIVSYKVLDPSPSSSSNLNDKSDISSSRGENPDGKISPKESKTGNGGGGISNKSKWGKNNCVKLNKNSSSKESSDSNSIHSKNCSSNDKISFKKRAFKSKSRNYRHHDDSC